MPSIVMENNYQTSTGSSSTPVEDLLHRSPVYTDDCDLYPRRMREVMNQRQCNIVVGRVNRVATPANPPNSMSSQEDIESMIKLYPGAARYLQLLGANRTMSSL
ncbi:hypothetical protein FB645_002042 [Coemansia sp. IMI 203386]|nr:hypothetical protein FB645_002042 [Coemansia sp. IMI 203386]